MFEPISKFKTFEFLERTKNGSEIKEVYRDKDDDRMHVVFYRPQLDDYGIGIGYNPDDGTWNQGRYDFDTLEGAKTILHRDYNVEHFERSKVSDAVEKQEDVEYKGHTIVHFPVEWEIGGEKFDNDSWIIQSKYSLGNNLFLPLYCEDGKGNEVEFDTLDDAKKWLDDFADNYKVEIKNRNEVHAVPQIESSEEWGKKAWLLGKVMQAMNDEEAYYDSGWLYIWPDGEDYENCLADFEDEEDYKDLEKSFKRIYKAYHEGGLFNADAETEAEAHRWDNELCLEPIQNIKR